MNKVITISLIITAIHVSMLPEMIFSWIRNIFLKLPVYLHNPLFNCLICMGGIYTIILYPILYGFDFKDIIITMLQVIGLNTIISALIQKLND